MVDTKVVLYISPFGRPNIGGAESSIEKIMGFASKHGYYSVLITYQPLTTDAIGEAHEIGEGFEIIRVSWFGKGWFNKLEKYFPLVFLYLFPGLFVRSFLYYLKNSDKICCIHAHGLVAASIGALLSVFKRKRLILSTHAIYKFERRGLLSKLVKIILSRYDKILAVSEVARNEFLAIGFSPEKVSVHKNWVDTDKWKPFVGDAQGGFHFDRDFNLLFVGRLLEKKGIKLIVEASKEFPDIGFHVVGNGPMEKYVEGNAKGSSNLVFHGTLNHDIPSQFSKVLYLYTNSDFLVSPYLYDEGFATVLVESLACGTPVIVTDRGSPPTFLGRSVAYFLSSTPSSGEIVDVIGKLRNESSMKFDRNICRQYAVDNFGVKNAEEVLRTYEPA